MDSDLLLEANWPKFGQGQVSTHTRTLHEWNGKLSSIIKNLCNKVAKFEQDLSGKNVEIANLKNELSQLKNTQNVTSNLNFSYAGALNNSKKNEQEVVLLDLVRKDFYETKSIENNIVIRGIPVLGSTNEEKEANDKSKVKSVLTHLTLPDSTDPKLKRISTKDSNANIIVVELNNIDQRNIAIEKARTLRGTTEFDGIYVNKDMTKAERIMDKKRRDERKAKNSELSEKDSSGRPFGIYNGGINNGKKFFWGLRNGIIKRVTIDE